MWVRELLTGEFNDSRSPWSPFRSSTVKAILCTLIVAIALLAWPAPAGAWQRMIYEDAQVVARSELIVVGAIKSDSVVVVPHLPQHPDPDEGHSWETHAILLVHDVIKGRCSEKQLPIIIRYGLDVSIDGSGVNHGELKETTRLPAPRKSMVLFDFGSHDPAPILKEDLRNDNLWFLRHDGEMASSNDRSFGIEDPEDVQPLRLKDYFKCYLAADPEPGVRRALQRQPGIAARALRYLQHRQVQRILKGKDPAIRVEQLLPYYQIRAAWGGHYEAREGIIAAGSIAGPYLTALYQHSWGDAQADIIRMWGQIRYEGCVPTLIELLKREDQFWAKQKLETGWWNNSPDSWLTKYRRTSFELVSDSVDALGKIGDPRAREAIELTRRRWVAIHSENPQIVEACDRALKAFARRSTPSPTTQ